METGQPWGSKNGDNDAAVKRKRVTAKRMVGLPGDTPLRSDASGYPVNRMFADVPQDKPEVHAEPGFEHEVQRVQPVRLPVALGRDVESVGLLGGKREPVLPDLARSSSCRSTTATTAANGSCNCPTRSSGRSKDRETGRDARRGREGAGDICCMPADIRHKGYSTEALDAAGLGERLAEDPRPDPRAARRPSSP